MPGERIDGRTVIAISGPEAEGFLQGLVTNDVAKLDDGLVYAAVLTPQGKYLADFFLLRDGDRVLLDVATPLAADLAKRLKMYKLRARVEIAGTDLTVSRGTGAPPEGALADPRHPALGWRFYGETRGAPPQTDWEAIRVAHCIPETGVELIPNETFILEAGFERLNGVDFRKGCYVGQEVTARMHHKTSLKKGLATVDVVGAAPVGTEIMAGEKVAGVLYSQAAGQGIAHLRFDRAAGEMRAAGALVTLPG